ncbi:hypothetical protein EV138_2048 [Kribbella voronezhensis]|uniref:Uncharacterized protein n=1 Tax=Kribbella voronezhensis TaxID=2512212 RepID=A0A4R7T960_9ACTN|nr:hypothetical protein EV138_2048 [Kribbella voronezhensis]
MGGDVTRSGVSGITPAGFSVDKLSTYRGVDATDGDRGGGRRPWIVGQLRVVRVAGFTSWQPVLFRSIVRDEVRQV